MKRVSLIALPAAAGFASVMRESTVMKPVASRRTVWLVTCLIGFLLAAQAFAQTNVVVAFTTTNSTPLNLGFDGFTADLLANGMEYGDTNLQQMAVQLSPGWLLYPGGTAGDAFDWSTGLSNSNWVNQIAASNNPNAATLCQNSYLPLIGRSGLQFTNFAGLAASLGGAKIIVCINGFTDFATNAGAFAALAQSNHIPVAAWELCNEPYTFKGPTNFFMDGTDYANKMLPFYSAIKNADSNAVVAVFFGDPADDYSGWNNDLTNYPNRYWDAAVYHHYPPLPTNVPFASLMALDNDILFSNTLFVTDYLIPGNNSNVTFFITEMNPCKGNGNGVQNPPSSSLYGGVWSAEYVMRMSTIPQMKFAGSFQLANGSGVDSTNGFSGAATRAADGGYVTNTTGLPFGYFLSAQGTGEAVAYWAINRSTAVYATSVGTNCPVVPRDTNGLATMPAVYAQAYLGGNGKLYVLLTNKGTNTVLATIKQDTVVLTNQFLETYVTATNPAAINSNPPSNNVVIQSVNATNPVTIPEYSVVRLEWTVSNVPPPKLSLTVSNATQNLRWAGLTNAVYNVQGVTNLLGSWTTLGRVGSTETNFGFTNWNSGLQQFYRLSVP